MIVNRGNTPRWIVFVMDLGICMVALILAYLVRFNFNIPYQYINTFEYVFPAVLSVRAFSFLLAKTYSGIIRYTGSKDTERIFVTVTLGSVFFMLVNIVKYYFDGVFLIPISILIIDYLVTLFLMVSLRLSTKMIYFEISQSSKEKVHIVIYGAGESGIITKRTLDRDTQKNQKVIAFVDDNQKKVGKSIERIKIIDRDGLTELLEKGVVDKVIISIQDFDRKKKEEIIDLCYQYHIEAQHVPPISDWINGELSSNQIRNVRIEDLLGRKQIRLDKKAVSGLLSHSTILVTGGAGSIGSEMARQISIYNPKQLILLDQAESDLFEIERELIEKFGGRNLTAVIADIRNKERVEKVFHQYKPNIVFHAAAYKHVPLMESNPEEAVRTNVLGTKHLVDLADAHNVERFVMVSTDKAVNPTNVMGASKRIAEIYTQSKNKNSQTKYVTTRFGNVLGSNGSVIPVFRKQIENGGPITVTHKDITRFFMTIPEACQLVLEAGTMGNGGEIFIFDMGEPVRIFDLAKKMIKLSGLTLGTDIDIKVVGLRPGEKLYEELLANEENTQPTHHPQIMIARVKEYNWDTVNTQIETLINSDVNDTLVIVKKMKELVPEYISQNSDFSSLDK